jgi:hypothetical protein
MRIRHALASLLVLALGGGCSQSVGNACDEEAAFAVYYRAPGTDGTPMFAGQALVMENCVSCHGEMTALGAPEGLNFPLALVTAEGDEATTQARRLLRGQSTLLRHRDLVHGSVAEGSMPPRGFGAELSAFEDAAGNRLPGIRTPEGQETLRNWLACRAPVVERTTPLAQPCAADADCPVTGLCDTTTAAPQCVAVGWVEPLAGGSTIDCAVPQARWSWIHTCVFSGPTCTNAGCHGATAPAGGLAFPDIATGHANLVGRAPGASSPLCMGAGPYVVAGDADGSLLVHKLEGEDATGAPVCGTVMPIGATVTQAQIDILREWIDAGAAND